MKKQPAHFIRPVSSVAWGGIILIGLFLSGCAIPSRERSLPKVETSQQWTQPTGNASTDEHQDWWTRVDDPQLTRLVETALSANADLAVIAKRVDLMRAEARVATAGRQPNVTASTGLRAGKERTMPTGFRTQNVLPWTTGAALSWELDWLGKWKDRSTAAKSSINASEADLAAGRLLLSSSVAQVWVHLHHHHHSMEILKRSIKRQEQILSIYQYRFDAGLIEETALHQQNSQIAELRRQMAETIMMEGVASRELDRLCGAPAGTGTYQHTPLPALPALPSFLPIDVLRRRPDMAAAEQRLKEAYLLERTAKLDLFPSLSLNLSNVTMSGSLSDPFRSWVSEIGPRLEIPVWDANRRARSRQAKAQAEIVAEQYKATTLRALEDVEKALVRFHGIQAQLQHAEQMAIEARKIRDFTKDKLKAGLVSDVELLQDEQRLDQSELKVLMLQADALANAVDVYRAMGG